MKFEDFKYERPNIEKDREDIRSFIKELEEAKDFNGAKEVIGKINKIRNNTSTMMALSEVRHTINTEDEFYNEESDFWDENSPLIEEVNNEFYKALLSSPFKDQIGDYYGETIIKEAEYSQKSFSKEVIEDMQLENKLGSQYQKLIASAKIEFDGEERTLAQLVPFVTSEDREVRKRASEAKYNFFVKHEDEIDDIFDKLVKVRTKIAKKLGFNNFVELGYVRMRRYDYNKEMVENFRKQVEEFIVPIDSKLYERQAKRLGLETLKYYDEKFEFLSGNPTPKGDSKWIVENAKVMYSELSKETKEFFDFMVENDLMDLVAKKGKAAGGYCTNFPNYKAPFIFSNFNGTAGDVDVLTHEAGHAFQNFRSSWIEMQECQWPTMESCEIHSMSMEFFTWPWMYLFFKEDTDKYKFYHLVDAIKFIPYGVTVDEFQHFVYENPECTPKERKDAWRRIEKKYLPHKNYDECDFLERGGWWFQQNHIFLSPFYYIDYTLAQICALQFWKKDRENHEKAWEDYLNLCNIGGTKTFLGLLKYANLKSPFENGCVESVVGVVDEYLESIDDSKF
ncbi:M3 family oligoendopeptidase [Clostridium perfringens]|uniref:M3 family oligoendopeptidase n=1 Tax=Clostridium perfringens TaxID=1502 RepID=UPI000D71C804|nr:M3 family oligoendopeptidase [Clostridium perfringens]MBO3323207.1 M3 family oligoendopeptidase [Clostridium perfringens]MBO3332386.1 M3 family oligoendopeptidase [Clostridium perfringens]PWW98809.1 M3 family oligoendopeptidase [Clostridium perfringens]PWX00150.1 M3 family oligoendopeptidase [Clostridium perfringens]PWX03998.1 M3 family oligoendopeptidase [Clostridium perfringens]